MKAINWRVNSMRRVSFAWHWLAIVVCVLAAWSLVQAQQAENVKSAMSMLKAKAANFGTATIKSEDSVAGKTVPALFFGETKMNNNFTLVDEAQKKMGGAATFFVKNGDDFVRVATTV
jgi:hypothetical protein